MSIFANRFPNIFAAMVYNEEVAKMTRQHHNSNVLCLGVKQFPGAKLLRFIDIWLNTSFMALRHKKRLEKIEELKSYNDY